MSDWNRISVGPFIALGPVVGRWYAFDRMPGMRGEADRYFRVLSVNESGDEHQCSVNAENVLGETGEITFDVRLALLPWIEVDPATIPPVDWIP